MRFVLLLFSVNVSCSSDDNNLGNDMILDGNTMDAAKGICVSDARPTMGTATVNLDKTTLSLTNFETDDAPRLLLFLSTDVDSKQHLSL